MRVISVVNQKGGCGKTITAVNLSAGLAEKNSKVLLIDLDPQGHATFALRHGLENLPPSKLSLTITDILEKVCQNKTLPKDNLYISLTENLSLTPASVGLASLAHALTAHPNKLLILSSFLKNHAENFDYVILDCPPNLGLLTLNALVASDYSIVPLMTCDFSLKGVEVLKNIMIMIKEFKGKVPTPFCLLTQVDKRSRFAREFGERVRNQLGNLTLNTSIRGNIHLREAIACGKDIFSYRRDSRGAQDYLQLTEEIEKITGKENWASLFLKGKYNREVYVVGDFTGWKKKDSYKLKKIGQDIWSINLPLEKGKYRYKFLTENQWLCDPYNKLTEDDRFGGRNSLLIVS